MAFEKRVCVLKQIKKGFAADGKTLSGAVHAERLGEDLTLTVRLIDTAPVKEGRFVLTVWAGGKTYCHDLVAATFRITGAPSIKEGFAALVSFVKAGAEPVAYGYCGSAPEDYAVLLNVFREEEKRKSARTLKKPPQSEKKEDGYDDEAIASANYYTEQSSADADDGARPRARAQKAAQENGGGADENAKIERPFGTGRTLAYYDSIKERLLTAFERYPRDRRLNSIFPTSEWVKAEGALLGIIYENGSPRYLCVAVEKTSDPPEEMKDNCVFVPRSHYTETEGFYVVFQDADTGAVLKIHNS